MNREVAKAAEGREEDFSRKKARESRKNRTSLQRIFFVKFCASLRLNSEAFNLRSMDWVSIHAD
jgi:hypothetical protein